MGQGIAPPPPPSARCATITVEGPLAIASGIPRAVLDTVMAFDNPKRFFTQAFRQGRWDGKVRLYEGRVFPAGFVPRLARAVEESGAGRRWTAARRWK